MGMRTLYLGRLAFRAVRHFSEREARDQISRRLMQIWDGKLFARLRFIPPATGSLVSSFNGQTSRSLSSTSMTEASKKIDFCEIAQANLSVKGLLSDRNLH